MRTSEVERRVLDCVGFARRIVPDYARGKGAAPAADVQKLARYLNVRTWTKPLDHPALLLPPIGGQHHLIFDRSLHKATRDYVIRHELGHLLAGDVAATADELLIFQFTGPLPEAEDVADLFALSDLLDDADINQGETWVAERIQQLVQVDYEPWYRRVPRLAPGIIRMRKLIEERL